MGGGQLNQTQSLDKWLIFSPEWNDQFYVICNRRILNGEKHDFKFSFKSFMSSGRDLSHNKDKMRWLNSVHSSPVRRELKVFCGQCRSKIRLHRMCSLIFDLHCPSRIYLYQKKNTLTLSQTTKFRLFQTQRLCRRQFQIWWKWQEVLQMGIKHCGKRRNCSLRAISPFPSVFSKDLYCRRVKTRACFGKG